MGKTNTELVAEFFNIIDKEMGISDIFEMIITQHLPLGRGVKIDKLINEKLNSYGFAYNHKHLKNGNLLIFKNRAINYVQANFI